VDLKIQALESGINVAISQNQPVPLAVAQGKTLRVKDEFSAIYVKIIIPS